MANKNRGSDSPADSGRKPVSVRELPDPDLARYLIDLKKRVLSDPVMSEPDDLKDLEPSRIDRSLSESAVCEERRGTEEARSKRLKPSGKPTTPLERIEEDKAPKGPRSPDRG